MGDCNIQVGYLASHMNLLQSLFILAMNKGAAGACQKCSIESVNKQIGGKSLSFMRWVGGEVTE